MTTTTSKYQTYPDFFDTKEECENFKFKPKIQTNLRYKNFTQTHFTAGDEQQFEEYKFSKNNLTKQNDNELWIKYHNLSALSVSNTFRYLFYKFKKGLFVKIVNNELRVFLPFSNSNFQNEWSNNINSQDVNQIFEYVCKTDGRIFNERRINSNISSWYCNNFLIRYEYPIKESDTNICVFKNMIEELCSTRKVPDIEFFINRRDFPLHTTSNSEPYFDIWNSEIEPLKSHNYETYSPILSMCKTDLFEDVLIPTHEDWTRIQSNSNIWFPNSNRSTNETSNIKWKLKKPIAVFRGSSTGKGVSIETNPRLKVAYLSSLNEVDGKDNLPYLDAGITKWNVRPRKCSDSNKLQTIKIEDLPFGLTPFLPHNEQCEFKYIIHIDGHVSAFRLSMELGSGSVVLLVESEWKVWYSHMLKPFTHYVPIKNDLSDLLEKIKWCKSNDRKCQEISKNSVKFYKNELQKDSVLDHLQKTLFKLKKHIGNYYYFDTTYNDIKIQEELIVLNKVRDHPKLNLINIDERNEIIYKSKTTLIEKIKVDHLQMCKKVTNDGKKEKENIHDAFVGIFCINKILKEVPNFSFTYGLTENKNLYNEYIPNSVTLLSYIQNKNDFNFENFMFLLIQLCLALQVSQNKYNFVHYDLSPWNILIQELDEKVEILYKIGCGKSYRIQTKIIPVMIDYGKSYFSHRGQHNGFVKLFKFSSSQDILTILITSIYEIIVHQHLSNIDFQNLLKLSNFLTGGEFRKEKFRNSKDLKIFLSHQKKFAQLIDGDKYDLERKSPMDLFCYIQNNFYCYKLQVELYKVERIKRRPIDCFKRRKLSTRKLLSKLKLLEGNVLLKNIVYDERDFYSLENLEKIKQNIENVKLGFSENVIINRYNLTNINDFDEIVKKLIQNNPTLETKFHKIMNQM